MKIVFATMLVIIVLVLSGCSKVVMNSADELTMYMWGAQLENGNEISLKFDDDNATLSLILFDDEKVIINGLCELSDTAFVIHDEKTKTPYAFSYIVHFDRVEIIYGENTVSLYKS